MTGYTTPTVVDTTIKDGADKLTIEAIATLYNYKLLAAVRENVSNALDANTDNNATDPVTVRISAAENGNTRFTISDSGKGMSATTLENDYLSIGISSKRDRDDLIGGHGIGVLATFCATTTTTIVTTHEGKTTSAIGTDHGSGHIQWVFNTTDAAATTPHGTTVSFDTDATPDEVAAVIQWLVMTAYLRDLKIIITNTPLLSTYGPLATYRASAMADYTDNNQACTFYPYGVKNNPSTARSYIDLDYLIGVRTGRYTVPILDGVNEHYIPLSSHMISINGLAYTVYKAAEPCDIHITIITPEYLDSTHTELELSSIPRNREYVEAANPYVFNHTTLDNNLHETTGFISLVDTVIDNACAIIDGRDNYLDHDTSADLKELLNSPTPITDTMSAPARELNALIAAGLFLSMGSESTHASPFTTTSPRNRVNPLSNLNALTETIMYGKQANQRLATALKNNSVRAVLASPNKALNDKLSETAPVHHLVDIWPALDSSMGMATGLDYYDQLGESKVNLVVLDDAIPDNQPDTLSNVQRSGLAARFTRSARGYLMIHKDDITRRQLRLLDISFNLYRHALYYLNANIVRTPFTHHLEGNQATCGTWAELTTPPAKKKTKQAPRVWKHAHFTLDKTGVLTFAEIVGLSIDEARSTYDKPHIITVPQTYRAAKNAYIDHVEGKDSDTYPVELNYAVLPYTPPTRRSTSHSTSLGYEPGDTVKYWTESSLMKAGWAELHNQGITDVYVYADKSGSTVEKLSRTSWIDTWEKHALPAIKVRKRADSDRADILREYNNILNVFCVGSFGNDAVKNNTTLTLSRLVEDRSALRFLTHSTSLNLLQHDITQQAIAYADETDRKWLIPWFAEIQFGSRNQRRRFHTPANYNHAELPSYLSDGDTDVNTINTTIANLEHILAMPGITAEKMGSATSLYALSTVLNRSLKDDGTALHTAVRAVVRAAGDYAAAKNEPLTPPDEDHVISFFAEHGKETDLLARELARIIVDSAQETWNIQADILTTLSYVSGTSVNKQDIIDSLVGLEKMYAKISG